MSDEPPTDATAPVPEGSEPSESESQRIREALLLEVDGGADLRDREARIAASHKIAAALAVPYGNVAKQVGKVLKLAAKNTGAQPETATKKVGTSRVTINVPKATAPEETALAAEQATTEPVAPAKPKMSAIYAAAKGEAELRGTLEYKWLHKQVEVGVKFIEGMYGKLGIIEDGKGLAEPKEMEMMQDMTVQICMKYDWSIPDRMEKIIFIGAWGMLLVLPPLAKFGILDDIKSGKLGKGKKDAKKSDEPLTDTEKKV